MRKVMGGVGNFQLERIFFFAHCLYRNFVFGWNPLHEFCFETNIALFWAVKPWFIIYVFVLYKLFYTQNRSKDIGHFLLMQNLFENVHTVREEKATWSGRLPCAFFQSLPSGILLPQPIVMIPYSFQRNSPSVCSVLYSKMSGLVSSAGKQILLLWVM